MFITLNVQSNMKNRLETIYSPIILGLFVIALYVMSACDNSKQQEHPNEIVFIPSGFQRSGFEEYVPTSDVEYNFLCSVKEIYSAYSSHDWEHYVALYYPDIFRYVQEEYPNMSLEDIREMMIKQMSYNDSVRMSQIKRVWDFATGENVCITDIRNRVIEKDGMLFLYEYHQVLYSVDDTIYNNEPEYGVAVSIDKGNTWYGTASDISTIFKILGYRFSERSINEVLTQK